MERFHGAGAYPVPFAGGELDFRPALMAILDARRKGRRCAEVARAFHRGLARGIADGVVTLCESEGVDTVAMSGGVFQNELLLQEIRTLLERTSIRLWANCAIPPNDGGISLGQAALTLG